MKELFSLRWVAALLLFVISLNGYSQETSLDNYTGYWSDDATWVDGLAPTANNLADNVIIYGYVTRSGNLSTTDGPNLTFTVNDTLVIRGDFSLGNKTSLVLGPNAILIVDGNYSSGAQVDVGNNGKIIVTGTVDISNSNQTDFDNSGDLYVFDVGGSNFGNNLDAFDCEPVTDCGVMEEDDLATNDPGLSDFFEDVINPNPAPVITTCAADRILFADASCQATVPDLTGEVVATDDGTITSITQSPAAGSLIGLGVTTITITVTDDGGKTATCSADILVSDNTAPVPDVAALSDVTAECSVTTLTAPTATDNCDGAITGTHNVTLPITAQGTMEVTWTYTDAANNSSTQTQNVVIEDVTAPVISGCPADITVTADDEYCGNTATWTAPTATDNCNVTLTSTHNPGDFFDAGTTTVIYTAIDDAGNTATCSFDVIVQLPAGQVITGKTELCTPVETTYSIAPVAGKSYLWTATDGVINGSDSGTEVSIIWSGNTTGTVTATLTSGSGCTVSSTENIIQHETPVTGEIQSSGKLTRR